MCEALELSGPDRNFYYIEGNIIAGWDDTAPWDAKWGAGPICYVIGHITDIAERDSYKAKL